MISYELAKELKEAGFPQEFKKGDWGYAETDLQSFHGWIDWSKGEADMYDGTGKNGCGNSEDGFVRATTLSRLIEACGDDFYSLHNNVDGETQEWIAKGYSSGGIVKVVGTTPDEAVARLWLQLQT